jgi:hypothetical protein
MINEMVALLVQKTGLSQDKAQEVVQTVVTFLKTRLPAPIANHLDMVLNSNVNMGEVEAMEQKAASMLGGMFGKKTE